MLTIVCIFLALALITSGNSYVKGFFTSFLLTPLQQVAAGGTTAAGDALTPPKSLEELTEENKKLREENKRLTDELVDYYDIKNRNEELNRFYNIKAENQDFTLVTAKVIGRDPLENFYGMTLDKGSVDGVDKDDPVMTENGLVGIVSEVSPKSCRVITILCPDIQVGVADKKTDDNGVLSGRAELSDKGYTVMNNLSEQNKAETGDIVVTSGYGGIYPDNIKIGKIKELSSDSYTSMPMAVIEPYEDVRTTGSVAIITDFDK